MFQTSVIASGSKGNCILVRSKHTALIIDAGISLKRIFASLDALKVPKGLIQGVIISHEHSDHTRSAGALSRSLKIPVYISPDTYAYSAHKMGELHGRMIYFESGSTFEIGDIEIHPFSSSHDAIDSCNFYFEHDEKKLGLAIDLGFPTKLTTIRLSGSSTLILESNHDLEMLMNGPYDPALKQRVKSNHGHLSNEQAVGLISQLMHPGLQNLILAHLSETNNLPQIAYSTMKKYLDSIRSDVNLMLASQDAHTPLIDV